MSVAPDSSSAISRRPSLAIWLKLRAYWRDPVDYVHDYDSDYAHDYVHEREPENEASGRAEHESSLSKGLLIDYGRAFCPNKLPCFASLTVFPFPLISWIPKHVVNSARTPDARSSIALYSSFVFRVACGDA